MPGLFISVVIPTCHRNDLLAKCLDRLAPGVQNFPPEHYEVIVSDDGEQTTAEEMIKHHYPWVKWIAGPGKRGPGANRNSGTSIATGEWLVFTDDDCIPDLNWLSAFAAAINNEVVAIEGAVHPDGSLDDDLAECPVNLTGGCFWAASIAVRHDIFKQVGCFDENYKTPLYEDIDLYWRLKKLAPVPFVPEAKVVHPVRVVPLKAALTRIPKICAAWAYHTQKHQARFGYRNNLDASLGVLSNGRGLYHALSQNRWRTLIVKLAYLALSAQMTYYYRITNRK